MPKKPASEIKPLDPADPIYVYWLGKARDYVAKMSPTNRKLAEVIVEMMAGAPDGAITEIFRAAVGFARDALEMKS